MHQIAMQQRAVQLQKQIEKVRRERDERERVLAEAERERAREIVRREQARRRELEVEGRRSALSEEQVSNGEAGER